MVLDGLSLVFPVLQPPIALFCPQYLFLLQNQSNFDKIYSSIQHIQCCSQWGSWAAWSARLPTAHPLAGRLCLAQSRKKGCTRTPSDRHVSYSLGNLSCQQRSRETSRNQMIYLFLQYSCTICKKAGICKLDQTEIFLRLFNLVLSQVGLKLNTVIAQRKQN